MGTCRMGSCEETSAIDEDGECWEVDNLYVTDGSTFPSASGANPMVTILTISDMVSRRLVSRLKTEDGVEVDGDLLANRRRLRREREEAASSPSALLFGVGIALIATAAIVAFRGHFRSRL